MFHERGNLLDAVRYLLSTPAGWFDRADALSNILLYLPLGFFGARAIARLRPGPRVLAMALFGGALSVAIEITQFWDLTRATQMSDVTANLAGSILGAAVQTVARTAPFRPFDRRPFASLLFVTALGMWLFPYWPSIHPARWMETLETAISAPFDPFALWRQTVFWIAAAALGEEIFGSGVRVLLPVTALAMLLARIAIPLSALAGVDAAGAIAGVVLWLAVSKLNSHVRIVAALLLAYVIVDAMRPFTWLAEPRHFEWTPFLSFMMGPRRSGSRVFLEKTFTYGASLWLLRRSGLSWWPATLSSVGLMLILRMMQIWLPDRSAEITDALMTLVLALVMKTLGD